ncbi:hypothetical protein OE88DRAFT_1668131 [Heliocybe sulcata]|uniref:Uncharacterized protein n=1 Tax=Heliocybe sulcata TaxID=5364 RepID=A0A5C3MN62_9AGAM|nr:hypothetical protein OE88DRAFT_1668131 [Heliocybe sulcata]
MRYCLLQVIRVQLPLLEEINGFPVTDEAVRMQSISIGHGPRQNAEEKRVKVRISVLADAGEVGVSDLFGFLARYMSLLAASLSARVGALSIGCYSFLLEARADQRFRHWGRQNHGHIGPVV